MGRHCNKVICALDPFGTTISIIGDDNYKAQVNAALDKIRSTPTGAQIVKQLEDSKNVHSISFGINTCSFDIEGSENGKGTGSDISFDPETTSSEGWERPTWAGLAHEMVHASDADKGRVPPEGMTTNGVPDYELSPCRETNRMLKEDNPNASVRTMYGDMKLPPDVINPTPRPKPE